MKKMIYLVSLCFSFQLMANSVYESLLDDQGLLEKKEFAESPIDTTDLVQTTIKRTGDSYFEMKLDDPEALGYSGYGLKGSKILFAKKNLLTSKFEISIKRDQPYRWKLDSSLTRKSFTLRERYTKSELLTLKYKKNRLVANNYLRQLDVKVKAFEDDQWHWVDYSQQMPHYNRKVRGWSLNFWGRVKMASIKNFILIRSKDASLETINKSQAAILFGKVAEDYNYEEKITTYHLDFRAPITPVQAFAIALSAF